MITATEYDHRLEVKAAIDLVRRHPELARSAGWASYANRLMEILGVPPEDRKHHGGWDMPMEFMYAYKREVAGWSKDETFKLLVLPALKRGHFKLDGPGDRSEGDETSQDAEGRVRWGRRAAGILIKRTDINHFLLVLRSESVMDPNVLGIPGGRIEPGESPEEAALSESEEELGPLPPMKFIDQDEYVSGEFSYTTFLAYMDGKDAEPWKPELNWENVVWLWITLEDLRGISEVHPNVRRLLKKWSK